VLGFLGANGAGKTTAMRAIFDLVRLDAGTVCWDGCPVGSDERNRFGYMPEERGLYPRMAVAEQIAYFARLHGANAGEAERRAVQRLEEVGLEQRTGDRLDALSHGNQQRAQLAAAIVHDPELLVLDEPFAGLDPAGVEAMKGVLRREADAGKAVVFSSHQLDLVESLCEDIVVLDRGRDVISGRLEELGEASGQRRVSVAFAGESRWSAADPEVTMTPSGQMVLTVAADIEPGRVLDAAQEAGNVTRFCYEPPPLSELYVEAVDSR
jgi:ABC-2 type transport system ATP-binding protein